MWVKLALRMLALCPGLAMRSLVRRSAASRGSVVPLIQAMFSPQPDVWTPRAVSMLDTDWVPQPRMEWLK